MSCRISGAPQLAPSRQRDCHIDDTHFVCLLKNLLTVEGMQ